MPEPTLVVPVTLDALVVDAAVLARDGLRWWPFNYLALRHFRSPEPEAFDRSVGGQGPGVYLHWELPAALRTGAHDPATGEVDYPLVPNRWLVVRYQGTTARTATGWVIESDCPFTSQVRIVTSAQTSAYLADPALITAWKASADAWRNTVGLTSTSKDPQIANIGIPFELASWSERSAEPMFLTAVAPGNPYFGTYVPHNLGVFSFYDALTGVDVDTLSYSVIGWYSDPARDIAADWTRDQTSPDPFAALLTRLDWDLSGSAARPTRSLYEGAAFAVPWHRAATAAPSPDPLQAVRDRGRLDVAIANTTVDAFLALLTAQIPADRPDLRQVLTLLRTFLYDLLPLSAEPGGDGLVARTIEQSWFGSSPGGRRWAVVPRPSRPPKLPVGTTSAEMVDGTASDGESLPPDAEPPWVASLNATQDALDGLVGQLFEAQWRLMGTWLKDSLLADMPFPPDAAPTQDQLDALLDPASAHGVVAPVLTLLGQIQGLLAQLPRPVAVAGDTPQDAFLAGVEAYATSHGGLPADQMLVARGRSAFRTANNPVIVLSGVSAPTGAVPAPRLPVRIIDEVISTLTVDHRPVGPATAAAAFPLTDRLAALPAGVTALVAELVLLDSASAPSLASASGLPAADVTRAVTAHDPASYPAGRLPALPLDPWTQPWQPMFLEWRVSHRSIGWQTAGHANWAFDGVDYHYAPGPTAPDTDVRTVGGISLLGPEAQFVFRSRLTRYVEQFGGPAELAKVNAWVEQVDGWQFLAQTLVGFGDLLACRDGRAFRRPAPGDLVGTGAHGYPVASLAGFTGAPQVPAATLPMTLQGQVTSVPYLPTGSAPAFHGLRAGQLHFTDLLLYDKFGRVLLVIESGQSGLYDPENFPLVVDPALTPRTKIDTAVASVVELPPRLLQPARLDVDLLDGKGGPGVHGLDAGVNPVGGWVLPDHLDGSLLLYAPDGQALGTYRLTVAPDGTRRGTWQPPPHTPMDEARLAALAPLVAKMVFDPGFSTSDAFATFLDVVDSALWTVDPLGGRADQNLSVLVGRPLALVAARLAITLDGPPRTDPGWAATLNPPAPDYLGAVFPVRLGDQSARDDGLMGYFLAGDYATFHSVAAPEPGVNQSYVRRIGPPGAIPGNYVPLVCTPGSSVEVTLLIDPRAAVHAVTGLLPVVTTALPAEVVGRALRAIEITFTAGPLPTVVGPTPTQAGHVPAFADAVTYPRPTEQHGTWSWWQPGTTLGAATGYDLVDAVPDAQFRGTPVVVVEGALQLLTNLSLPTGATTDPTQETGADAADD